MREVMLLAMFAFSGCATLPPPSSAASAPAEPVGLTIKSWGKPLFDWTLAPDGTGIYTYADEGPTKAFRDYVVKTKRISVGRDGYARLAALLAPARRYAGAELPCQRTITDMPYGTISWGPTADLQVKFDLGCQSSETKPVHEGLVRAQDLMKSWADTAAVVETRPGN
ncbi:hypothetical protein [Sphingomonas sp.]|uniref:hypothetical protein n=1 Tax=Sphingomonas sp. TaxID=28214 RepID=UPI003BA92356